jgi:hypothetical protein
MTTTSKALKYDFRSSMGIWQTKDGLWHTLHAGPLQTYETLGDAYRAEQEALRTFHLPVKRELYADNTVRRTA